MPSRALMRSFLMLWFVTGVVLLLASIATLRSAHANPHIALLASTETIAAVLFLIPRTMRLGAIGLLVTIAIAFSVHAFLGHFRGDLLLYASAVAFVAVHGPLTHPQWRATLSSASS